MLLFPYLLFGTNFLLYVWPLTSYSGFINCYLVVFFSFSLGGLPTAEWRVRVTRAVMRVIRALSTSWSGKYLVAHPDT